MRWMFVLRSAVLDHTLQIVNAKSFACGQDSGSGFYAQRSWVEPNSAANLVLILAGEQDAELVSQESQHYTEVCVHKHPSDYQPIPIEHLEGIVWRAWTMSHANHDVLTCCLEPVTQGDAPAFWSSAIWQQQQIVFPYGISIKITVHYSWLQFYWGVPKMQWLLPLSCATVASMF